MIRVSVMYPHRQGGRFDLDYYVESHMALVRRKLAPHGLVRTEVDKGVNAGGQPQPFAAAGHLYFETVEAFQSAFKSAAGELMADVPNYTDLQPQVQVSEIVAT
jgi:uncharacterized protein (TIGR02118 family)